MNAKSKLLSTSKAHQQCFSDLWQQIQQRRAINGSHYENGTCSNTVVAIVASPASSKLKILKLCCQGASRSRRSALQTGRFVTTTLQWQRYCAPLIRHGGHFLLGPASSFDLPSCQFGKVITNEKPRKQNETFTARDCGGSLKPIDSLIEFRFKAV